MTTIKAKGPSEAYAEVSEGLRYQQLMTRIESTQNRAFAGGAGCENPFVAFVKALELLRKMDLTGIAHTVQQIDHVRLEDDRCSLIHMGTHWDRTLIIEMAIKKGETYEAALGDIWLPWAMLHELILKELDLPGGHAWVIMDRFRMDGSADNPPTRKPCLPIISTPLATWERDLEMWCSLGGSVLGTKEKWFSKVASPILDGALALELGESEPARFAIAHDAAASCADLAWAGMAQHWCEQKMKEEENADE